MYKAVLSLGLDSRRWNMGRCWQTSFAANILLSVADTCLWHHVDEFGWRNTRDTILPMFPEGIIVHLFSSSVFFYRENRVSSQVRPQ